MSRLNVDKITGATGTASGAPITLSGDTATLGSGATLGSAVTFPAGHIIQTTHNSYFGGQSTTTTSATTAKVSDGSGNYYWKGTISNLTSGNDVLINFNFVASADISAEYGGGSFALYRDDTIIYEGTSDLNLSIYAGNAPRVINFQTVNIHYLDESPSATSHTYFLGFSAYNSTGILIRSYSGFAPFIAVVQEIQT